MNYSNIVRFLKYASVGVVTNATAYCVFLAIIWSGGHPVYASAFSYIFALLMSYIANRKWTFKSKASQVDDIIRFSIAYGVGFIYATTLMYFIHQLMRPELAQIINIITSAVIIYSMLIIIRFGKGKPHVDIK